jgi:hypothetical protein
MKTTKHNIIVIIASVLIAIAIPFVIKRERETFAYKTFHHAKGWGYDILVNGKLFIHQENIPAISTEKGFDSATQASAIAAFILNKIKNNKPPTLTQEELRQICPSIETAREETRQHE